MHFVCDAVAATVCGFVLSCAVRAKFHVVQ
jgi:hypothetical protein